MGTLATPEKQSLDELSKALEIGVASCDVGIIVIGAADSVKILGCGRGFEKGFPHPEGDNLVPVSVEYKDRDLDLPNFGHIVVPSPNEGTQGNEKHSLGHIHNRRERRFQNQSGRGPPQGLCDCDRSAQGSSEQDDPIFVDVLSRQQIANRPFGVGVGSLL